MHNVQEKNPLFKEHWKGRCSRHIELHWAREFQFKSVINFDENLMDKKTTTVCNNNKNFFLNCWLNRWLITKEKKKKKKKRLHIQFENKAQKNHITKQLSQDIPQDYKALNMFSNACVNVWLHDVRKWISSAKQTIPKEKHQMLETTLYDFCHPPVVIQYRHKCFRMVLLF